MDANGNWAQSGQLRPRSFKCGYSTCGREVSSEKGWTHQDVGNRTDGYGYICPMCQRPTFFDEQLNTQMPGVSLGNEVKDLPAEIGTIWSEIRRSTSDGSYTSAVLMGRKLLMHIAVDAGAKAGAPFVEYVNYLADNHYAPPKSKEWVDKIRAHGNEANHEIIIKKKEDAEEIMVFLEMLLRFIYEFPARAGI
jgi:Domain of unknown function (DUF4145)